MSEPLVIERREEGLALVGLNDPARRNALGLDMFDALDGALERAAADLDVRVVLLYGEGPAFCAGFDLSAAAERPELLHDSILRLSGTIRELRRMRPVVVAAVRGAAIAGGCAILSACDLAVVAPDAKIGYPVHRLGISPAVSMPTLLKIGAGRARRLQVGGELIDGTQARAWGLASHVARSAESVLDETLVLGRTIAGHGAVALRVTKAWCNELDGSLDEGASEGPALDTAREASGEEAVRLLAEVWSQRKKARGT